MASVNLVILVGNLGADPDVRYLPSGEAVANLSIATTDKWKDKSSGELKQSTEWHRVVLFGRLAEIAGQYLQKGSQCYIEGAIRTKKWQDKETGQDRYSTEIRGTKLQLLGSGQRHDEGGSKSAAPQRTAPAGGFGDMDDDVPFDRLARGIGGHAI